MKTSHSPMRKTKSIATLVLNTAAALSFIGCREKEQVIVSDFGNVEYATPAGPYVSNLPSTNRTSVIASTANNSHNGFSPWVWMYMGRSTYVPHTTHYVTYPGTRNYTTYSSHSSPSHSTYTPSSTKSTPSSTPSHVASAPSAPSSPSHSTGSSAGSVSRGGFGSTGHAASSGSAS